MIDPTQKLSFYLPRLTNSEIDPNNPIAIDGNYVNRPTRNTTIATQVTGADSIILANATGGTFAVTLPDAVQFAGRYITIRKIDSSGNAVTINTLNSQTINGSATQSLTTQWTSMTLESDGSNWIANPVSGGSGLPLSGGTLTGPLVVNSANVSAFAVGPNGATNPTFSVNTSNASQVTGLNVFGNSAGNGVILSISSTNANENLYIQGKGTGQIHLYANTSPNVVIETTTGFGAGNTAQLSLGDTNTYLLNTFGAGLLLATNATSFAIQSATSNALAVGANGLTNPVLKVDASTASSVTGLSIKGQGVGAGVNLQALSSGANEALYIDSKGSSNLNLNAAATGKVVSYAQFFAQPSTAAPAAGAVTAGILMSSIANFGIFFGSGAPTFSAAQGSIYMRTDGNSTSTRQYINGGTTTWIAVTTAS